MLSAGADMKTHETTGEFAQSSDYPSPTYLVGDLCPRCGGPLDFPVDESGAVRSCLFLVCGDCGREVDSIDLAVAESGLVPHLYVDRSKPVRVSFAEVEDTLNVWLRLGLESISRCVTEKAVLERHARLTGQIEGVRMLHAQDNRVGRACSLALVALGGSDSHLARIRARAPAPAGAGSDTGGSSLAGSFLTCPVCVFQPSDIRETCASASVIDQGEGSECAAFVALIGAVGVRP